LSKSDWRSITTTAINPLPFESNQFQDNKNNTLQYSGALTTLRSLGRGFYLEPSLSAGSNVEIFQREQGIKGIPNMVVDSVSPLLNRQYQWVKPKLVLRSYFKKNKLNFGLEYEIANQLHTLNDTGAISYNLMAFLPQASWEYEYKTGHRLGLNYSTSASMPSSSQLQPIISTANPYAIYLGNRNLQHEYRHNMFLSWFLFDQFSFTSVFAHVSGTYTTNKIGRSIAVSDDLKQTISLINVPEDYSANARVSFSTPIRPLGVKISISGSETYNRTTSLINAISNINNNLTHNLRLAIDNRKKEKWDIEVGGQVNYTDSRYSIQNQLNKTYFNYSAFGEIRFTPSTKWHFRVKADVTSYDPQSFGQRITIPLIGTEINYYFLANQRAMLTLECSDLLNKNTGLSRVSDMNSLRETSSNTIGRYFMLSFKYRLNKMGGESSGIVVKMR
jgi:hypothetical protein